MISTARKKLKKLVLDKEEKLAKEDEIYKWSTKGPWSAKPDLASLSAWSRERQKASPQFFSAAPKELRIHQHRVEFESPVSSIYPENNTVRGEFFESRGSKAAVLLFGHWNSQSATYNRLAKMYRLSGISALRLSLPYHDERRPPSMPIATGLLSADINQTIEAMQQATQEARIAINWLKENGYERIGVVGASLGTAIALLSACHDARINAFVGYLTAADIADLIWQSSATHHLRESFEPDLNIETLREAFACINPANYLHLLARPNFSMHIAWAEFDTVCPPQLTRNTINQLKNCGVNVTESKYKCGHNTLATTPFIQVSGFKGLRFMRKTLLKS